MFVISFHSAKLILRSRLLVQALPHGWGGVLHWHWHGICICACLLGCYFAQLGEAICEFSSEMKEPKLHKYGVFWANFGKKYPIKQNWVFFFSIMVYRFMDNNRPFQNGSFTFLAESSRFWTFTTHCFYPTLPLPMLVQFGASNHCKYKVVTQCAK